MNRLNSQNHRKGSILVTSLVIGTILISAYFFFATRQLSRAKAQAETIEYQNQHAYLESYINYLTENPSEMKQVEFDNGNIIIESLSNKTDVLIGAVDLGENIEYDISGSDKKIMIEWNHCSNNYNADFILADGATEIKHVHTPPPPPSTCMMQPDDYDDRIDASIQISGDSFVLKTVNAPFYYRIIPVGDTILTDNQWHIKAHFDTGYDEIIEIKKSFTSS